MSQGKGSKRRPAAVPRATVDANYARTFTRQVGTGTDSRGEYGVMLTQVPGAYPCLHSDRLIEFAASPDRTDAQG